MTRKEALEELIAKVEVGEWPSRGAYLIPGEFRPADPGSAFNGSLDAAKALHEAVLPGWDVDLELRPLGSTIESGLSDVNVYRPYSEGAGIGGCDAIPARAWLLSILRALLAQEASA